MIFFSEIKFERNVLKYYQTFKFDLMKYICKSDFKFCGILCYFEIFNLSPHRHFPTAISVSKFSDNLEN